MNRREQVKFAFDKKRKAEARMRRFLRPLISEIAANYRLGDRTMKDDDKAELKRVFYKFYTATARDVFGFDFRQLKQEDDVYEEIIGALSRAVGSYIASRSVEHGAIVSSTFDEFIRRVTGYAIAERLTEREATAMVGNFLRNHSLIIGTNEAQFVEHMRRLAVVAVRDPLGNSVQQCLTMLRAGDIEGAKALSKQVMKVARLPVSTSQAELIRRVNDIREHTMTPYHQARVIRGIEEWADVAGRQKKSWMTVFDDKVRASHQKVDNIEKELDEPFELDGGLLQEPGDTSLGADLSEIINCRCMLDYV